VIGWKVLGLCDSGSDSGKESGSENGSDCGSDNWSALIFQG